MDWSVEVGQKVKDPDARLQSPEGLSTHMECHNLSNTHTIFNSISGDFNFPLL